jgi:hypothetical protein
MLLLLVTIFLIDSTLGKAFDSQCNSKDIFQNDSRGKQRAKEMLQNNHANFCLIPLKSKTNDGPASTIEQLFVPDNGPTITTSSFLQLPNDTLLLTLALMALSTSASSTTIASSAPLASSASLASSALVSLASLASLASSAL